jgi:shikimate dehydrogenase
MADPVHLALLGDPVAHSRSPAIQRAALLEAGLDGDYTAIKADVELLEQTVERLRDGGLSGVNITMPLKEPAFRLADELTSVAEIAGSVNSLRSRDRVVQAHTTDAVAFREILEDTSRLPADVPILVLGSGGTARALLAVSGSRDVYVSARSEDKAAALETEFQVAGIVPWGAGLGGALVVNATPLGMAGEPLAEEVLRGAVALIDLPYGEEETPAVRFASRSGLAYVDGVEFLARQARAAFEWWTGEPVHLEPLVEAARNV